jgi:hypothetical protein
MTLTDADIEAIFRAANLEFNRHYSPPLSAEQADVVRRVVDAPNLEYAARILESQDWMYPYADAHGLRFAARRFMSSKGAKP